MPISTPGSFWPAEEKQRRFYELWLPFEAEFRRLSTGRAVELPLSSLQDETRRSLLSTLWEERQAERPQAQKTFQAFSDVLDLYVRETQRLLEEGGFSQVEAERGGLENLSGDADFLQKANAYAAEFQEWLIDLLARGEGKPEWLRAGEKSLEAGGEAAGRAASAEDYVIQTSQESAIMLKAICDGKSGTHWKNDLQAGTRTYEPQGVFHRVQLQLSEQERDSGLTTEALEKMTQNLDADGTFAVLYVSRLLAPPSPLPRNALAYDWVTLDDVIQKIGWNPRSTAERQEMRRRVLDYLRFCARANLVGQRSTTYRDPDSKEAIPTRIEGPIWRFMKEEKPDQPSLFAEEEVPLRVQLAVSAEWTRLTTSPLLAQFLPMGELLGAIPPDKPSGAWARSIGLALAGLWRRKPRETLDRTIRPTRRELLSAYTPKITPPEEVLGGKNPRRALDYWSAALQLLADEGFVAKSGEATRTAREVGSALPRYFWQDGWLDEPVDLLPGPKMEEAVQRCAHNLPVLAPRNLKALPRKRGRPRKNP